MGFYPLHLKAIIVDRFNEGVAKFVRYRVVGDGVLSMATASRTAGCIQEVGFGFYPPINTSVTITIRTPCKVKSAALNKQSVHMFLKG